MGVQKRYEDRVRSGQGRRKSCQTLRPLPDRETFDWDTAFEREDDRFDCGEVRFVALGLIGDRLHVLAFTNGSSESAVRAISLRLAQKHEVRFYHAQV
jgi:uncharacterized DUF497 family protein